MKRLLLGVLLLATPVLAQEAPLPPPAVIEISLTLEQFNWLADLLNDAVKATGLQKIGQAATLTNLLNVSYQKAQAKAKAAAIPPHEPPK